MSNRGGGGDDATRSGAGWSAAPSPTTTDDGDEHAFAVPADKRYADLERVASGGMGTVTIARDHRLSREVAIKRVAVEAGDSATAARLAREAEITARLEHPNIVAIYDAGVGADGQLFYAMRLIRGRSLGEAAKEAHNGARPALLRHFLDVCHAMAYAHGRGIVHRDLKPANIMVGEFGETQIVDWGLAQDLASDAPVAAGEISGSPAYLAPECARGERGSRAADVWSLGAILFELIAQRRLRTGDRDAVLAAARTGTVTVDWPDGVPPEIRAIADKATAWDPDKRYPDAGAVATDVAAYLDGKRVGAHAYSSMELARRLVHAWRVPLGIIAAATLTAVIVLATMLRRVERQRADAQSALSWALDATAVSTLASGSPAEAEVIAAHALKAGESIEARGVLAAVRAGTRPTAVERVDVPGCGTLVPDDERHAICLTRAAVARVEVSTQHQEWSIPLTAQSALGGDGWVAVVDATASVVLLDAATGKQRARIPFSKPHATLVRDVAGTVLVVHDDRSVIWIDPPTGTAYEIGRMCGDETIDAVAAGRAEVFAVCATGQVVHAGRDHNAPLSHDAAPELARVAFGMKDAERKPASALALDRDEKRLAIGGLGGEVQILALSDGHAAVPTVPDPDSLQEAGARVRPSTIGDNSSGGRTASTTPAAGARTEPAPGGRVGPSTIDDNVSENRTTPSALNAAQGGRVGPSTIGGRVGPSTVRDNVSEKRTAPSALSAAPGGRVGPSTIDDNVAGVRTDLATPGGRVGPSTIDDNVAGSRTGQATLADRRGAVEGRVGPSTIDDNVAGSRTGLATSADRRGAVPPRRVLDHAIARLAFHGDHLVVGGEHGAARVWTGTLTTELLALPAHASAGFVVRGDWLISSGAAWWRWTLPSEIGPRVFTSDAGLSGAAVRDDGTWVAAARGDGVVEAWSTQTGQRSPQIALATAVIKRVDYNASGSRLAAAISAPAVSSAVLDTSTWQPAAHMPATRGVARIAYLVDEDLVGVHYGAGLSRWDHSGTATNLTSPVYLDGVRTTDRSALWLLTDSGAVSRLRAGVLEPRFSDPGARALSPADGDRGVLLMHPTQIALHANGVVTPVVLPSGDPPSAIALSPDASLAAVGTYGGVTYLWSADKRRVVAVLRGHKERVAWLGFVAGALWSASWDGSIRKWSLDALDAPASTLIEDAERTWRMNLDDALRR